jgi:SOS-response transcriptional repressor LexA
VILIQAVILEAQEKEKIRLQPANPEFAPIYRTEVEIRGVVIKIIRNLK